MGIYYLKKREIFADYESLLKMHATRKCKIKLLETLVAQGTNNWRVTGITRQALLEFHNLNFKYVTHCGIQRAHVFTRHQTYGELVDRSFSETDFWDFIADKDRTILAIKGEFTTVRFADAIPIRDAGLFPEEDAQILFEARSVGYRFADLESRYLKELYGKYIT